MMEHYGGSKNHHFIPQGVLKHFCFEGSSLLRFDCDRPALGIHQRNKNKSFQSFHSNSFETQDGRRNDAAESWLDQNVDNKIAPLIEKLRGELQSNGNTELVPKDRELLARYLCSSFSRKPSIRSEIFRNFDLDAIVDSVFEKLDLSRSAYEQENGDSSNPVSYGDALIALLPAVEVDEVLDKLKKWSLIIARPAVDFDQFVIGDALPIRLERPIADRGESGSEIWTTLAPDLAVCFFEHGSPLTEQCYFIEIGTKEVRELNQYIIEESNVVACKCPIYLYGFLKELDKF